MKKMAAMTLSAVFLMAGTKSTPGAVANVEPIQPEEQLAAVAAETVTTVVAVEEVEEIEEVTKVTEAPVLIDEKEPEPIKTLVKPPVEIIIDEDGKEWYREYDEDLYYDDEWTDDDEHSDEANDESDDESYDESDEDEDADNFDDQSFDKPIYVEAGDYSPFLPENILFDVSGTE